MSLSSSFGSADTVSAPKQSGRIFDVKKYAINDGPGIRVTLFFKGCPLRCAWCHNPESISGKVQKMYNPDKCIGCKSCIDVCPEDACELTPAGIVTDAERCTGCGKCADICPTKATEMSGRTLTLDEAVEIVEKERVFFEESGGGVTVSGGEPLLQHEFLIALLDELGRRGIHRAVDTTGFCTTEILLEVAKRTDLFLYDVKMMDSERHKQWTGVANEKIKENLHRLAATGAEINIRIPLVKNVNDDSENMRQTAAFVAALPGGAKKVNLLPYHNIAANKYRRLGESYEQGTMSEPGEDDISRVVEIFDEAGLKADIGG